MSKAKITRPKRSPELQVLSVRKIDSILEDILKDDILPGKPEFTSTEAPSYSTLRQKFNYDRGIDADESMDGLSPDPLPKLQDPNPEYEEKLDVLFWAETPHVILLAGSPACGKTTLVKYYLRSYCPHKNVTDRRKLFKKKLILELDFRSVHTAYDIQRLFWKFSKVQIVEAFERIGQDIETLENYAFFEDLCDFKNQKYHDTEMKRKGVDQDSHRNSERLRVRPSLDDELWVRAAFRFLERFDKQYFEFIVIVFDNLDQSPADVQAAAVRFVIVELKQYHKKLRIWKFILPLWPESIPGLMAKTSPQLLAGEKVHRVNLLGVDLEDYFLRRLNYLGQMGNAVSTTITDRNDAVDYVYSFYRYSRVAFFGFLNNLAGADIRFRKQLVRSTLLCQRLISRYNIKDKSFKGVGVYSLVDAMIKGPYEAHNRDDSPVANLFSATSEPVDERSLLIGVHLLYLLHRHYSSSRLADNIIADLICLGHEEGPCLSALSYFEQCEILKSCQAPKGAAMGNKEGDLQKTVATRRHVVNSYIDLLSKSAYIENMAYTTPISTGARKGMIHSGRGQEVGFFDRKSDTLVFLEFMCKEESRYCRRIRKMTPPQLSRAKGLIKKVPIPGVFPLLATAYGVNLRTESELDYLPRNPTKWNQLLSHPVFENLRDDSLLFPGVLFSEDR